MLFDRKEFDRVFYEEAERLMPAGLPWEPFVNAVQKRLPNISQHIIWQYFKIFRDANQMRNENNAHIDWKISP